MRFEEDNGWIVPGESSGGGARFIGSSGTGCIEGWGGLIGDGGTTIIDGGSVI
jgi:hypothetical protein